MPGKLDGLVVAPNSYETSNQGCEKNLCGVNAECFKSSEGWISCACPVGYEGDPYNYCHDDQFNCKVDENCPSDQVCSDRICSNPCITTGNTTNSRCGENAQCDVIDRIASCSCLPGYRGNPEKNCTLIRSKTILNGINFLSFKFFSFFTEPCSRCESDDQCNDEEYCGAASRCIHSCTRCQKGSGCIGVANHIEECQCLSGYNRTKNGECRLPECFINKHCLESKPVCDTGICVNPCDGACGVNAECRILGSSAACLCRKGFTGNPFVICEEKPEVNLCEPNPCGPNTKCKYRKDIYPQTEECFCLEGYTENNNQCIKEARCHSNYDCDNDKVCVHEMCLDPCKDRCGENAICTTKYHVASCTCREGTSGDPFVSCKTSKPCKLY